ncbi:MAG: RecQ family ATP-dependent DNA helicase, partial [Flavobacteriales bacterium]|nr:RecQ family ATP-dependent DNA helicase [Flavobacteriales bacterium]
MDPQPRILPGAPRDPQEVLRSVWGYERFRPGQQAVVDSVLGGKDTLALLPTGGGKSLCFQVPAIAMGRLCLVISPLIALMKDQVERLKASGVRAAAITSGMDQQEIENAIESAAVGRTMFLYVSPERLATEIFQARLPRMPLGLIAVDEAHCVSQWGYDFRPSYLNIAGIRKVHPEVPVLALTASATPAVAQDIMQRLEFREPHLLRGSFARPELTLWISNGEDKMGRLLRVVQHIQGSGIVYLRERKGTVRIANFLQQFGIPTAAYHAGLSYEERDRVQHQWNSGAIRFVAATNAFGMGIDKSDVRSVIHLEPPPDVESYYQEAGRAGRDGRPSHAFMLVDTGDEKKLRDKFAASFPTLHEVRRTYQAFADLHHIAIGSGMLETYDLDLRTLAERTKLSPATVNNCLKALELDGSIMMSEGARTPSRVGMRASDRTIYDLRVKDPRTGPLLEALLRLHGGLFEEPAIIDEVRIARLLDRPVKTVIAQLHELDRQRTLFYKPRNDSPTITLLVPRRDAAVLMLDKAALDDRKERARLRMEAMIHLVFHDQDCRECSVLRYFGEPTDADCGRC